MIGTLRLSWALVAAAFLLAGLGFVWQPLAWVSLVLTAAAVANNVVIVIARRHR